MIQSWGWLWQIQGRAGTWTLNGRASGQENVGSARAPLRRPNEVKVDEDRMLRTTQQMTRLFGIRESEWMMTTISGGRASVERSSRPSRVLETEMIQTQVESVGRQNHRSR